MDKKKKQTMSKKMCILNPSVAQEYIGFTMTCSFFCVSVC